MAPEPGTRRFEPQGTDQTLAWMIIVATIPVGIAGLLLEHTFRTIFSRPLLTSSFLFVNGLILLAGEARRRRGAAAESEQVAMDVQMAAERQRAGVAAGGRGPVGGGRHSSGQRAFKQEQASLAVQADRRLTGVGFVAAFFLGAVQILALLPGISRDGIVMVSGMFRGLSRQDAARFSFLLSAPVILAAGVLKIPDLTGPLGAGIRGQVLFGSLLSFIGAYFALRFLVRYLSDSSRTLTPFAIYCLAAGAGAFIYLTVR
jgi:undecaprenyl-diphosphatase